MKFKLDENMPAEAAELLRLAGYDALTVVDQKLGGEKDPHILAVCQKERRTLITLDLDFADVRTYPPKGQHGLIVMRLHRQDKPHVLSVLKRTVPLFSQEELERHLWIVEESRVRVRGEET